LRLVKVAGFACGALVALTSATGSATEEERRQMIRDTDGPPSMPGLSHRDNAFNFEYTIASAEPTDVSSAEPITDVRAYAYSARWLVEAALFERAWYLGASSTVAAASVPSSASPDTGGSTLVLGNPELWLRGLWSSTAGLSAGGGLALVVPVPRTFSTLEAEVVRAIRVVRPGDYSNYQDLTLTARPFFDIRHVTGPVTLQMRQGVDFSILVRDRAETEHRYDLTALATAYLGVRTFGPVTLGLEVQEVYQITAEVRSPTCLAPCDQHRVQVTLSPIVRIRLPPLSPSLSALFPVSTPLRAEVASYYAARLHLEALF